MFKRPFNKTIIRVIYILILAILVVTFIMYVFPLPGFIVKPIISDEMRKATGMEVAYDSARVTLITHNAILNNVRLIDPATKESLAVESVDVQLKLFPFRIRSVTLTEPEPLTFHCSSAECTDMYPESKVLLRLLTMEGEGELRPPPMKFAVAEADVNIIVHRADEREKTIHFSGLNTSGWSTGAKIYLTGYTKADIFDVNNNALSFNLTYNIEQKKLYATLRSSSLLLPVTERENPLSVLLTKAKLNVVFDNAETENHILTKFNADKVSIIPVNRPQDTYETSSVELFGDLFFSSEAKNALHLKELLYTDEDISIKGMGNISSEHETGYFFTEFTAENRSETFFERVLSLIDLSETVRIQVTKDSKAEVKGIVSGRISPFRIARYNVRSALHNIDVTLPDDTHMEVPLLHFAVEEHTATIKSLILDGEFGTLDLTGTVSLVSEDGEWSFLNIRCSSTGDADCNFEGGVNLQESCYPFSGNLLLNKMSPDIITFLLKKEFIETDYEFEASQDTEISGKVDIRAWLKPCRVGHYTGHIHAKNVGITVPDFGSWQVRDARMDFEPDLIIAHHLLFRGSAGDFSASGNLVRRAVLDTWRADFQATSTLQSEHILNLVKQHLPEHHTAYPYLSPLHSTGMLMADIKGDAILNLSEGFKLEQFDAVSKVAVEDVSVTTPWLESPLELSGRMSLSENQLLFDNLAFLIENVPVNVSGRIYSEPFFWKNPGWDIQLSGLITPEQMTNLIAEFHLPVEITSSGECTYSIYVRKQFGEQGQMSDLLRLSARVDGIDLSHDERSVSIDDLSCLMSLNDEGEIQIDTVSCNFATFPVLVKGKISLSALNVTVFSDLDLGKVREELLSILEPVDLAGTVTLNATVAYTNPASTPEQVQSPDADTYKYLATAYREFFESFVNQFDSFEKCGKMFSGEVTLHNNVISYCEFPVLMHNISGTAFFKDNRLEFDNVSADCGNSTNTINAGTLWFREGTPVFEVQSNLKTFYLDDWLSGWNPPCRKTTPTLTAADPDRLRFRLKIEGRGEKIMCPPLESGKFQTILEYFNYPRGHGNLVRLTETSCDFNEGELVFEEGKIHIKKDQKIRHTWNGKINAISLNSLQKQLKQNGPGIYGNLSGTLTLEGVKDDLASFKGQGNGHITDSRFIQIPIFTELARTVKSSILRSPSFSSVYGNFIIENETINFPDIVFYNPAVRLAAKGSLCFDERVDFVVYLAYFSGLIERIPFIGGVIGSIFRRIESLGAYAAKYRLSGSLDDPNYYFAPFSADEIISAFSSIIK